MLFPISVLDVEISKPICSIHGLDAYPLAQFIVRLFGRPLGYITMPVSNGKIEAVELINAIISKHAYTILRTYVYNALCGTALPSVALQLNQLFGSQPVHLQVHQPLVSVVVCTRNRPTDIAICLAALDKLTYKNVEIIVVDNAPENKETEYLISDKYPGVRYVCEPRPGLNWARNRGITEAKGEIIAYTDDDVIVDENWVSSIANLFAENNEVMAATGLVVPYEMETQAQMLFEKYGGFGRGFYRRWIRVINNKPHWGYLGTGQFGTGANMAFRRSVFHKLGFFNPALDVGTVTNGGGDLEMYFRVIRYGSTLVYEPNAMVRHRHRREYQKLKEQLRNNSKGLYSYCICSIRAYPELRFSFFRLIHWWMVHWIFKKIVKSFIKPSFLPRDLILAELNGCFKSFGLYKKARKKAAEIAAQYGDVNDVNNPLPKGKTEVLKPAAKTELSIGHFEINLMEPITAIPEMERYARVQIGVFNYNEFIGQVEIISNFQNISTRCMVDAIADKLSFQLIQSFNKTESSFNYNELITLLRKKFSTDC